MLTLASDACPACQAAACAAQFHVPCSPLANVRTRACSAAPTAHTHACSQPAQHTLPTCLAAATWPAPATAAPRGRTAAPSTARLPAPRAPHFPTMLTRWEGCSATLEQLLGNISMQPHAQLLCAAATLAAPPAPPPLPLSHVVPANFQQTAGDTFEALQCQFKASTASSINHMH